MRDESGANGEIHKENGLAAIDSRRLPTSTSSRHQIKYGGGGTAGARKEAERRRHGCARSKRRGLSAAHCSRSLPSGVTAARCRRRSLPTKGSPDVAARGCAPRAGCAWKQNFPGTLGRGRRRGGGGSSSGNGCLAQVHVRTKHPFKKLVSFLRTKLVSFL